MMRLEALIKDLRTKATKATDGPWQSHRDDGWPVCTTGYSEKGKRDYGVNTTPKHASELSAGDAKQDAEFIAACNPTVVLALLDLLEFYRGEVIVGFLVAHPDLRDALTARYRKEEDEILARLK